MNLIIFSLNFHLKNENLLKSWAVFKLHLMGLLSLNQLNIVVLVDWTLWTWKCWLAEKKFGVENCFEEGRNTIRFSTEYTPLRNFHISSRLEAQRRIIFWTIRGWNRATIEPNSLSCKFFWKISIEGKIFFNILCAAPM